MPSTLRFPKHADSVYLGVALTYLFFRRWVQQIGLFGPGTNILEIRNQNWKLQINICILVVVLLKNPSVRVPQTCDAESVRSFSMASHVFQPVQVDFSIKPLPTGRSRLVVSKFASVFQKYGFQDRKIPIFIPHDLNKYLRATPSYFAII